MAYAIAKWLECNPVKNKLPMSLEAFYKERQRNDKWIGEDYDGTSVRAAFKVFIQPLSRVCCADTASRIKKSW